MPDIAVGLKVSRSEVQIGGNVAYRRCNITIVIAEKRVFNVFDFMVFNNCKMFRTVKRIMMIVFDEKTLCPGICFKSDNETQTVNIFS